MKNRDLVNLLNRAAAALETPDDLSEREEVQHLVEDLLVAARDIEASRENPTGSETTDDRWVIMSQDMTLMWSNKLGWVTGADFDIFTTDEMRRLSLPSGGEWFGYDPEIHDGATKE